jgi:hypothetical protein
MRTRVKDDKTAAEVRDYKERMAQMAILTGEEEERWQPSSLL